MISNSNRHRKKLIPTLLFCSILAVPASAAQQSRMPPVAPRRTASPAPAHLQPQTGIVTQARVEIQAEPVTIKSDVLKTFPVIENINDPFQIIFFNTLKLSLERDEDMKAIDASLTALQEEKKSDKGLSADQLVACKDLNPIRDAAVALLDEETGESIASLELRCEKHIDARYLDLMSVFIQLSNVLGKNNFEHDPEFIVARSQLVRFAGDQTADYVVKRMVGLKQQITTGNAAYSGQPFTAIDFDSKRDELTAASIAQDSVMQDLTNKMNTLANAKPSKSKKMATGLSMLSMVPGGFGMLAGLSGTVYDLKMGSDESKMLYSVFLYKRIETRRQIINGTADQVLRGYEISQVTQNPMLLAFSLSTMNNLSGADAMQKVAGNNARFWPTMTAPNRVEATGN